MARIATVLLLGVATASSAWAQGDPEALSGSSFNKPTKSWMQWQPKPTYALGDVPDQYMGANRIPTGGEPQTGFNRCARDAWNQDSKCQTAWINDVSDWCIWGPPDGGDIGSTERIAVAYCTTEKHGTRLIPDGTLTSVHFLKTPNYVQVTGTGDFTKIGIPEGDSGGEMDPHGADDLGNPIGGILFTTANPESNGQPYQVREWTNFMSYNQYCLRACWGDQAAARCEHIYDIMGCRWNMPSESGYTADIWESCDGENAPLQGIYGASTFHQGEPVTPEAHPPAASSNCRTTSSLSHGLLLAAGVTASSSSSSSSSLSQSSSSPSSTLAITTMISGVVPSSSATAAPSGATSSTSRGSSGTAAPQNDASSGAMQQAHAPSLATFASLLVAAVVGMGAFAL